MTRRPTSTLCVVASLSLMVVAALPLKADSFVADDYVVATVNPLATDAGVKVLADGGNAIDAAIAAALTLAVVDGHNSGIGGGCLILIRTANGLVAIDGREKAPSRATADMFVVNGQPSPDASQVGPLASGVPGALAAYDKACRLCGSRSLSELLTPAIEVAETGFEINEALGLVLKSKATKLSTFPGTRAVYFKPGGQVYQQGDRLIQTDLASTLRNVAKHGTDWFYKGPLAERVGRWMEENGGLLSAADFADYEAADREPIFSSYRGHTVIGFPPPSSGGVHVAQALNMLENYDLGALHRHDPIVATHLVGEVFSRVFADRAHWLGDADFAPVPRGLLSKEYAKKLTDTIDLERTVEVPKQGTPPQWNQDLFGRHTTHISAVDSEGNWVAITATVNTSFGSGVIVPGTGVVLNNEMDDFSIQPGVPNAFGLVGTKNNAIAPGKRPLSSMSPTIVLDEQENPILTIGAAGGPKIITQVLLGIIRTIDYGESLENAIAGQRFHHQWRPNQLGVEQGAPRSLVSQLSARGHEVRTLPSAGVCQAIGRTKDGRLIGVVDPRIPGKAHGE